MTGGEFAQAKAGIALKVLVSWWEDTRCPEHHADVKVDESAYNIRQ